MIESNNSQLDSSLTSYFDAAMSEVDDFSSIDELFECLSEESYQDIDKIGEGGMKVIYSCRDEVTGRFLARAYPKDLENTHLLERFVREARLMAELEHPNIVPVHRIGISEDKGPYFTMKLVHGVSLKEHSLELSLSEKIEIFLKASHAVAYAHEHQIFHLDIKPDNISVSDYGEVLLMDWGLARRLEEKESFEDKIDVISNIETSLDGQVKGTPEYMSPEQASGTNDLTHSSDIYSLGSLLYFLLCGHSPYSAEKPTDILKAVQANTWQVPSTRFPQLSIPSGLEAILSKAMRQKTSERYSSVNDFRHDIQTWRDGFAPDAENASFLKLFTLLVARHKKEVTSIVIVLFLFITLSLFFISSLNKSRKNAEQERDRALIAEKVATDKQHALILEQKQKKAISDDAAPRIFNEAVTAYGGLPYELAMNKRDYQRALDNVNKAVLLDSSLLEAWELKAKLHIGRLEFNKLTQCLAYLNDRHIAHKIHQQWQYWQTPEKLSPTQIKVILDILGKHNQHHILRQLCSGAFLDYSLPHHLELSLHAMERRNSRPVKEVGKIINGSIELNLSANNYHDITALASLPLKALNISRNRITWLDPLSKQEKLEDLDVSYSNVHDLFPLWDLPLKKLNLRGTRVTNYSIHRLTKLEEIHIGKLRAFSLNQFINHPSLKVIYIPKGVYSANEIKWLKTNLTVKFYE